MQGDGLTSAFAVSCRAAKIRGDSRGDPFPGSTNKGRLRVQPPNTAAVKNSDQNPNVAWDRRDPGRWAERAADEFPHCVRGVGRIVQADLIGSAREALMALEVDNVFAQLLHGRKRPHTIAIDSAQSA